MPERASTNILWLTAGLLAGCSAFFDIDEPKRAPVPQGGGSGGVAGSAEPTGGGGASGAGQAGEGGDPGTGGTGGSAGSATGGAVDLGGSGGMAGLSGAGAEGGADGDGFEDLDAPCSTPGALACVRPAENERLICKDGVWTEASACSDAKGVKRNCDRRSGACAEVVSGCNLSADFGVCEDEDEEENNVARSCGPDLVSYEVEHCIFGCDDSTRKCHPQGRDQLVVDRTPPTNQDFLYWPSPVIPVCWGDLQSIGRALIRDEVESTWGRYSSITFSGWGDCSDPVPESGQVRISFDDHCQGELGGVSEYGYPGPYGTVEMRICRSYFDADKLEQTADEAMLRFVARHLFGHVLGLVHDPSSFMTQVIRVSQREPFPFDSGTIYDLQLRHGTKPQGSLVNAGGRCVAVDGDALVATACDGSSATRWEARDGQLLTEDDKCLRASGSEAATLGDCTSEPEFDWQTTDVRWQAQANRCVTVATSGSDLMTRDCRGFGAQDQTWSFEFALGGRVRILHSNGVDGVDCVHAPAPGAGPLAPPELAPCDGVRDEFATTRDGQLAFSGYCMAEEFGVDQYEVHFRPCLVVANQAFYLSGPFDHGSEMFLTLENDTLRATALTGAPTASQIFDYHF